jgi:hypothetical protein
MKFGLTGINHFAEYLNSACNLRIYAFQQYRQKLRHDATFLDYKTVGHRDLDLREPAARTEQEFLATIKSKGSSPAEVRQMAKDTKKWLELARGYRALEAERKSRYDEAFVANHLRFTGQTYYFAAVHQKTLKSRALEYSDRSRELKNAGKEPFCRSRFIARSHQQGMDSPLSSRPSMGLGIG